MHRLLQRAIQGGRSNPPGVAAIWLVVLLFSAFAILGPPGPPPPTSIVASGPAEDHAENSQPLPSVGKLSAGVQSRRRFYTEPELRFAALPHQLFLGQTSHNPNSVYQAHASIPVQGSEARHVVLQVFLI